MRLHPVIPMVDRTLTSPATIGGVDLPAGATIGPSILVSHARPDNYPEPASFRPERFVGQNPPTNTWIPFGGGVRRCIGAGFSLMEGVAVLREVLRRTTCTPVGSDEPKVRNITSVPRRGARIRVDAGRDPRARHRNPRLTGAAAARNPWRDPGAGGAWVLVTWGERLRAVRMDVTPLRDSRDFRLLFVAGTVFYFGAMVSLRRDPLPDLHAHRLQLRGRRDRPGRAGAAGRLRAVRRRAGRPRGPAASC